MNDAGGTARCTCSEISLFQQEGSTLGSRTFSCDRYAVYPAPDNDYLKAFAFQRRPGFRRRVHGRLTMRIDASMISLPG
jgi:hypothetical protein